MANNNNYTKGVNSDSSTSSWKSPLVYIFGTLGAIGTGFGIYNLGKKKGRKETEQEYKSRLENVLDRANRVLAKKESQK